MKNRFTAADITAVVKELRETCQGMRVHQIYDVDTKTYLIKLNRYEEKITLLLESGIRVHVTEFEWPKNPAPSGFSMKLRKHIKNKRLENVTQLGVDRIIDFQFGINEATYHVILELYDRGNLVLTDYEYVILNILRPRAPDNEDVKLIVRERYPIEKARQPDYTYSELKSAIEKANQGDSVRKLLLTHTMFGVSVIDHIMVKENFSKNICIGKDFDKVVDMPHVMHCVKEAEEVLKYLMENSINGYIIQKEETKSSELSNKIVTNIEFHPYLFKQHEMLPHTEFPSFNKAVDLFFSTMESQKIDLKTNQKEREAMKKLENFKKDHEQRLSNLFKNQQEDTIKAQLIEMNLDMVDKAIVIIRSAVANQISWSDIWDLIQESQAEGDPVAKNIKKLKLNINHFTMLLSDPFNATDSDIKPQIIDIDLSLSAYGNARKYYDLKRHHARKEQKTLEASEKAFKNAERKTKETLKEVAVISNIIKARKPMWFEKFLWCISSENYLIIAGRDIQQNEVIVKRYMKAGDIYVHADIHGASSVIIKNPSKGEVPPKTLNEAGTFSVCYSAAWNAKIMTSAWWVYHHQVSKTAPTGEYLTAGSFMIRGKKNYLLPSHLILGFGFLFKLHEDCIAQHQGERKIKYEESVEGSQADDENIELESEGSVSDHEEGSSHSSHINRNLSNESKSDESNELIGNQDDANNSSSEDENPTLFPDTKVTLEIGKLVDDGKKKGDDLDDSVKTTTLIISSGLQGKSKKHNMKSTQKVDPIEPSKATNQQNGPKRRQKSKLKKIKEKYKDQDDEERELRMKILASAGVAKGDKRSKKKDNKRNTIPKANKDLPKIVDSEETAATTEIIDDNLNAINHSEKDLLPIVDNNDEDKEDNPSEDEDEQEDADLVSDESNVINSLTGCPTSEDVLLFAVPVCGPYTALQNYKYKVKVMPGTGRRGKAAKTTLNIFLHDKTSVQLEKDCLRSVKDQDISRNFPGKVKLTYANVKRK